MAMAIRPKDRDLVAMMSVVYVAANVITGRKDVSLEEGVLYAQKQLEVIDRRLPNKSR